MTDALDEMRALSPHHGPRCDLCRLMSEMTPEHQQSVRDGMATDGITDRAVAGWITSKGYQWRISHGAACVRNHRQADHE